MDISTHFAPLDEPLPTVPSKYRPLGCPNRENQFARVRDYQQGLREFVFGSMPSGQYAACIPTTGQLVKFGANTSHQSPNWHVSLISR